MSAVKYCSIAKRRVRTVLIVGSMRKPPKLAFACVTALRGCVIMGLDGRKMDTYTLGGRGFSLPRRRLQLHIFRPIRYRISESRDNETILKQRNYWFCIAEKYHAEQQLVHLRVRKSKGSSTEIKQTRKKRVHGCSSRSGYSHLHPWTQQGPGASIAAHPAR